MESWDVSIYFIGKKWDNFARLLSSLSNVWRLKQGPYVYLFVTSHDETRDNTNQNGVPKLLKGALRLQRVKDFTL